MRNFIAIASVIIICLSCNSKESTLENKIVGQWSIEEFRYCNISYIDSLYINFIVFEKNNIVSIPESKFFEKDYQAKWNYSQLHNKDVVKIIPKDTMFNGDYEITFFKNYKRKLLGIELKSNKTYIKACKFFQNFNTDGKNW